MKLRDGGPLALVRDGARITIDAANNILFVGSSEAELSGRREAWNIL